jgi:putative addiction module component (TIGR02574 family)
MGRFLADPLYFGTPNLAFGGENSFVDIGILCYNYGMSPEIEHVMKQALELPSQARALIAEKLLESLDFEEPFDLNSEWRDEIERRCREIDEGDVQLTAGDKVFTEALKRLQK